MIGKFFHLLFFDPLYNLLMAISAYLPGIGLGGAIIILTLLVKVILLPLQHKTLSLQKKLKLIEPQLTAVKKAKNVDRNEQAQKIMALYREHGVNPLTTFWTLLIQIPIILALYWVFRDSTTVHPEFLYSFIAPPVELQTVWLGLINITEPFWPLAVIVGVTQFVQLRLARPPAGPVGGRPDLAQNMQRQMSYWLPVLIIFISGTLPAAISLYWLTSNLFAIGHELVIRRQAANLAAQPQLTGH